MTKVSTFLNYARLALFSFGYGAMGVLVAATLNRILISELKFSAALVGLLIAIPTLESPVRLWLGYRSDGFPLWGRRREPYIILGMLVGGVGLSAIALVMTRTAENWLLIGGLLVAFTIYGFGRNLGHNSFQALLAEKFTAAQKRLVTLFEVAALLGSVIGAGVLSGLLKQYDPARLVSAAMGVAVIAFGLALLAVLRQEAPATSAPQVIEKARELSFPQAVKELIMADMQVRAFFILVLFTFIGTLAQDVLLEPFGGEVLQMSVGETTRLTAYWGIGVMISMLLSGLFLIKWLGYLKVLQLGLGFSMFVFVGLTILGAVKNVALFQGLVFAMGLGTGLAGAGMLTGVMNFTTSIRAGLLLGVWGMANLLGKAVGSILGGSLVDVMRALTGNAFAAYATVFVFEGVLLLAALLISFRLNVAASQAQAEQSQLTQPLPSLSK